jgi:hypothetical protein
MEVDGAIIEFTTDPELCKLSLYVDGARSATVSTSSSTTGIAPDSDPPFYLIGFGGSQLQPDQEHRISRHEIKTTHFHRASHPSFFFNQRRRREQPRISIPNQAPREPRTHQQIPLPDNLREPAHHLPLRPRPPIPSPSLNRPQNLDPAFHPLRHRKRNFSPPRLGRTRSLLPSPSEPKGVQHNQSTCMMPPAWHSGRITRIPLLFE